jgi:hypothetical protein
MVNLLFGDQYQQNDTFLVYSTTLTIFFSIMNELSDIDRLSSFLWPLGKCANFEYQQKTKQFGICSYGTIDVPVLLFSNVFAFFVISLIDL